MLGRLKIVGILVAVVVAAVGGGIAVGVLGTPSIESVDNRFVGISENTTAIETDLTVNNPNPIGVQLGGISIDYTVSMNGVALASGDKEGVGLESGNSTLTFATDMQNDRIPAWWYTHIDNGETSQVTVDANVTSSTLGDRSVSIDQEQTVETDIVSQFNSTETRPVNASRPFVSDPVLYINETTGKWDRQNVTREETPLDLGFTVYNPKSYPYTISKIGYTISMNNVSVGEGETDRGYTIGPKSSETIEANTAIQNDNLDEWWVTHLERNQETELYIDFYFVLEGGGEQFRVDVDSIDYEKTIETDIFGNKAQYPTGENTTTNESSGAESTPTPTPTDSGNETTETDDGILGSDETTTETDTATPTPTPTSTTNETETATDDGLI